MRSNAPSVGEKEAPCVLKLKTAEPHLGSSRGFDLVCNLRLLPKKKKKRERWGRKRNDQLTAATHADGWYFRPSLTYYRVVETQAELLPVTDKYMLLVTLSLGLLIWFYSHFWMEKQSHCFFLISHKPSPYLLFHTIYLFSSQLTDRCGCMQMAFSTFSTQVTPEHLCRLSAFSQIHTWLSEVSVRETIVKKHRWDLL